MDMDNNFGLMVQFIAVNIIKEKNKDMESLFGKIKALMKDSLKTTKLMEMAFMPGKTVEHIRVNGRTIK
jgi:hypothetical protein